MSNKKQKWETIIDFTKYKKGGVPIDDVVKALNRARKEERKKIEGIAKKIKK